MSYQVYYSHLRGEGSSEVQTVDDHLWGTAELAEKFFKFDDRLAKFAHTAGLIHDLGKFSDEFQDYIRIKDDEQRRKKRGKIDHSTAGAQVANEYFPEESRELPIGRILEYAIACHHTGLINGGSGVAGYKSCLKGRLKKKVEPFENDFSREYLKKAELSFEDIAFIFDGIKEMPPDNQRNALSFRMSFLIRMVFSALVDADWLDTERFMDPEQFDSRGKYPSLKELAEKLDAHLAELGAKAPEKDINKSRAEVLQACRNAADLDHRLFTLTVPTGGGKTLSSLAFALKHALKHGMDRVIYVIPYTSIIEQNAKVFREALGYLDFEGIEEKIGYKNSIILRNGLGDLSNAVVEHHSNFEEKDRDHKFDGDEEISPHDLACENWDAPIVVTTNVQFFESMFASKKSRCRKLHNIANSVIILDEAQMLPVNLLRPCIEAISELSARYHSTVVLCTATQPALNKRDDFKFGLEGAREIVGDKAAVDKLYNDLKRVEVEFIGKKTDDELVGLLKSHEQALCIVNTKGHARKLFEELLKDCKDKDALFHLSTNLCPAHRSKVFNELIKPRLGDGLPCVVISTQLVEAGVDIDFPTVYRATAGIDSIAQAAGRCNREGKLKDSNGNEVKGKTYVFETEAGFPKPLHALKQAAQVAEGINRRHSDLLGLDAVEDFFKELFWVKGLDQLDSKKIIESLAKEITKIYFPFRDIAEAFRLIDSPTTAVLIEYNDEARKLAVKFRSFEPPTKQDYRKAQRYTVSLYQHDFNKISAALEETERGVFILPKKVGKYNEKVGIVLDIDIDPTNLYISNSK